MLTCQRNTGFVTSPRPILDDTCPFSAVTHTLYNVGGATGVRIVSMDDNTKIWRNSENDFLGTINRDGVLETTSVQGDVFYACGCIFGSGEEGNADIELMPDYLASDVLGATMSRYGGIDVSLYSLSANNARIFRNGNLEATLTLTPDTVTTFTKTGNYVGNWKVEADGQILGFKREDNQGNGDSSAMMIPSTDILGWASTLAYIAKESGSATPLPFQVYSHLGNYTTGTIATTYNIVNSVDLPHTTAQDNYYDPRVNIRVQANEGLYGVGLADSNGGNCTALVPVDLLTTHHKIPQPAEYIAISAIEPATVDTFNPDGSFDQTITLTKVNTDPLAPYSARIGTIGATASFPVGYELVGSSPITVVYQPEDAGGFGSDEDEQNSYGYNKNVPTTPVTPVELPTCNNLTVTFFNQAQFSWGFGLQNNNNFPISQWQLILRGTNYQLDPTQITNSNEFDYVEVDNGNGTWDLYLTSNVGFGAFQGQTYQWNGVNFGFTPTTQSRELNCVV